MTERQPAVLARTAGSRQAVTLTAAVGAVAVAIWLLPASLQIVAWPRSGPHRIAVFAPLYRVWWIGAAAAAVLGAVGLAGLMKPGRIQRAASAVAPLNLLWIWVIPYLPWIGDRFPILLALAGPARWIFAAAAVTGLTLRLLEPIRWQRPLPGRKMAFAAALMLYLSFGLYSESTIGLGGDEPHYLVITHSLLVDHDLKIENNHAAGDYRPFFNGTLRPDYLQRGVNGEIYSIHAPGLSALLLPAYTLAGARGAVMTMCLLAALTALAIFDIVSLVARPLAAWLAWLAVCLTVPLIPHAWAVYPEMAGAAIVAWAVNWALDERMPGPLGWAWRGCCLAWLPWLHTKFSVFLVGLAALLLWQLRGRWRQAAAMAAPIAISLIAWLVFFRIVYGSFDPQAPYGGYTAQFVRMENVPRSLLGLLFDQKFGVLAYAPIYALIVPGMVAAFRDARYRLVLLAGLALAAAYALSSARLYMWWGGSSAPARFLVPVVPLLAPLIALGITQIRGVTARATWTLVGVTSVAIGVSGAVGTAQFLLFSAPHGFARLLEQLQGGAPLAASIPTFTQEDWISPTLHLAPWLAAVLLALAAAWLAGRFVRDGFWIAAIEIGAIPVLAAVLVPGVNAEGRTDTQLRGELALLERFDPERARAFDYSTMARLTPPEWLAALEVTIDREPGSDPDEIGRLTDALKLPAGVYEARVWFEGDRPRSGSLQAAVGNGYQLARIDEPLRNPSTLEISLPVAVPSMWIQLTDQGAARAVRRVEIRARSVEPASRRGSAEVAAVEAFDHWPRAYLAYLDENTFPEHGVFWTRATAKGRLMLAPAGARTVTITVHLGPNAGTVSLRVGAEVRQLEIGPEGTEEIRLALPADSAAVPIEVQSTSAFRPADVDTKSDDTRQLGCQVRLVLE